MICTAFALASLLVSTGWLADRLQEPSVVVLHVGSQNDYEGGHIPGARLVSLADISITGERGLRLELPPPDKLREAFERVGVNDSSRVVVYAGNDSVQSATRVWFTLDYLGLGDRAAMLDGGLKLWKAEARPLSTEPVAATPGKLSVRPKAELVVDYAAVRAGGLDLIDARTPEYFAAPIPGARNVPFSSLLDPGGKFKPEPELRKLLGESPSPVVYCHIGQQATVPYFVARLLGFRPRLYDGSYQDFGMQTK